MSIANCDIVKKDAPAHVFLSGQLRWLYKVIAVARVKLGGSQNSFCGTNAPPNLLALQQAALQKRQSSSEASRISAQPVASRPEQACNVVMWRIHTPIDRRTAAEKTRKSSAEAGKQPWGKRLSRGG